MRITDIIVRKTFSNSKLKAIVSIVLEDCIAVHDIKVVQGISRLYVAMPTRKGDDNIYRDIVHPMCPDARVRFEDEILNAYERYIALKEVMDESSD